MNVSVVIPTRNRSGSLAHLLSRLSAQSLPTTEYEVLVVDDGSQPPVRLPDERPLCTHVIRLEGRERSAARNAGAQQARAGLLLFLDDDLSFGPEFLRAHLAAHDAWPESLVVGAVRLPDSALRTPFGDFRARLEAAEVPPVAGPAGRPNFCTAQNMSLPASAFAALGGFDERIVSSEDQDLALRHVMTGGRIVYWPAAEVVHMDSALEVRSYCRRAEWGMEQLGPFLVKNPTLPENVERAAVNGRTRWGREPVGRSLRKAVKVVLASRPGTQLLFATADLMERSGQRELLEHLYRLLLGVHLQRGYRRGLSRRGTGEPP